MTDGSTGDRSTGDSSTGSSTGRISRTAASDGVQEAGWRYLLGSFHTVVAVSSLAEALAVATAALAAAQSSAAAPSTAAQSAGIPSANAQAADDQLRADVRADRVELVLLPRTTAHVDDRSIVIANRITAALAEQGWSTVARTQDLPTHHGVQAFEIAIDTLDMAAIRPFWKAVLAYVDEPGSTNALVDPLRQGPAFWFQRMDEPRPQRNRIHFDLTVPHDEAQERISAALAAGGVLVSDAAARSFWVLADREGNEICVCTWQDRDP